MPEDYRNSLAFEITPDEATKLGTTYGSFLSTMETYLCEAHSIPVLDRYIGTRDELMA